MKTSTPSSNHSDHSPAIPDKTIRSVIVGGMTALLVMGLLGQGSHAAVSIDQMPLTAANNVPSNLVLTPSVEWPTVMSMSNIAGTYSSTSTYGGYFDSGKCYSYQVSSSTPTFIGINGGTNNYFYPVSTTTDHTCSGYWSGNYLNWVATQTIDTFRSSMTGGYRVVDTTSLTILEKARHTGQTTSGARRSLSGSTTIAGATPSNKGYFYTRLDGLGNRMWFEASTSGTRPSNIDSSSTTPTEYTGGTITAGTVYSLNIDVQVCASGLLETNFNAYGSNYKPEGLIQKYAKTFKYSVFGYLNMDSEYQDGAALRAKQKFVGQYTYDPILGTNTNTQNEWDPSTGIFIQNPNTTDATNTGTTYSTTINDSGVINYLNKFGEMTATNDKSHDPVSEMYYAAIRYLKHQGPVAAYSNMTTYGSGTKYQMADGFPVITSWDDPVKYYCQKNYILGIGDVNTWDDKNLPGSAYTTMEPAKPAEVTADTTVNVNTATQQVATLEGITINNDPFSGRNNSAYIAGLAYDSHVKDMRPDLTGSVISHPKVTVSTYWVDVMENQVLRGKAQNQYWLAAKYGGFTVPSGYSYGGALTTSEWFTNGTTLSTGDSKPDNFFTGGDATTMKSSLDSAFAAIAADAAGSIASLSLNSTQLKTGSTVYQAGYASGWSGSLTAYAIDPTTKKVATTASWTASLPAYASRNVHTSNSSGVDKAFNSTNVTGSGWTAATVNYVLGDTSNQVSHGGTLRNRTTALGDIIDSQPIYVGSPSATLFTGSTFTGSSAYASFVTTNSTRTPTIYVAANDGMLHAFNAGTSTSAGVETYAYMPYAVWSATTNPSVLAQTTYGGATNPHQYFNDGELTVSDVYYSSAWHTILVGTTGRGNAKAIYALDVTNPSSIVFLWEKSGGDIGQMAGKPIIAQTSDGHWAVLIGNGYNSSTGTAKLLRIALDGTSTPAVTQYTTDTTATNNGLSTPAVWIADASNSISTTAYAGDLAGNIWAFDLSSTSGSVGSGVTRVFTTPSQPITASLLLGKDPVTGHLWTFFGTGKYLTSGDLSDMSTQSWYGMIVDGTLPVDSTNLVHRSITAETTGTAADPTATPPVTAVSPARAITTVSTSDMSGKSGWYLDLTSPTNGAEGERMIVGNQFQYGLLVGSTLIPDTSDACSPGGRGWVMAVNPFLGTNPGSIFFDINGDGAFGSSDEVTVGSLNLAAAGMEFSSLTGSPAFVGSLMLVNQNGIITPTAINPQSGIGSRVSWREIINQ
jgi:type IV pilus assembly protein PilY1